ncbi:Protein of unknown function [Lactobacillus acidophilus DSM 9126]|nr:Protein of unknown function [Lactobacillus acidophilus DSM 20079 = JCM 1132 = NBRC 13951 = CIP 76.13]CDF68503.1 Protein of unknown function [Lactobacillus acidophilus CIRM-BIA 442]CDF72264.1 Protein of unknown function [Lactobacillus acidophilus CIRM-BIA 445]CDF74084.1 Protein of unknown function [Lactobacillus acidophilus DSM 9126]CDF76091.1 Protein of unknown function [Lactobacillus acidophilus DSM 20242]
MRLADGVCQYTKIKSVQRQVLSA